MVCKEMSSPAFKIKPLKEARSTPTNYNKNLPQPLEGNFRIGVFGASGQGKSVLLLNMLMYGFRKHFLKIIVFSFHIGQFKKHFSKLMTKHDVMFEKYDEKTLKHHFDKQVARNRKRPKRVTPLLLIFDDMLQVVQKSPLFKEILLVGRKESVSIVYTAHKMSGQTDMLVRQNTTHFVVLSTTDMELRLLGQTLSIPGQDLIDAWHSSGAKEKFSFLHIITNPASVFFEFSGKKLLG